MVSADSRRRGDDISGVASWRQGLARKAVEDWTKGIRSAAAAGTRVIAIPNRHFPPDRDALAEADIVLGSLHQLGPEAVESG